MAPPSDLIDFEIIEGQKENIQALPSGRSAKALASLYSPPPGTQLLNASAFSPSPQDAQSLKDAQRLSFEDELSRIDEADDPLDIYDRYVKWTLDAYPSASATKESGLLQLLERATKSFLKHDDYKNDARYLKLWLLYIKLFCQGSESASKGPSAREGENARDTYIFLSRNAVGQKLALFYESFAEWLELKGRWQQAAEIWHLGIERQARPTERLIRRFDEFEKRRELKGHQEQGPSSPALPTVRPALGVRRDPFSTTASAEADPQAADRERDRVARAAGAARSVRRPKLEVFADSDENGAPKLGAAADAGGWESIGGLNDRRKENKADAQPWNGQKLDGGKKLGGGLKMQVFKDPSKTNSKPVLSSFHEKQTTVNPRSGRPECVFVDLEAVYPNPDASAPEEYCFEELRASSRGWMDRDWAREKAPVRTSKKIGEQKQNAQEKNEASGLRIFVDEDTMSARKLAEQAQTDEERANPPRTTHRTVPLNDENRHSEDKENADDLGPLPGEVAAKAARKAARREEKANRTRKIRVMEVKAETQTVQANLSSPTGPKLKRKKSSEPTMTVCTKEAMDEIYDIFNQERANPAASDDGAAESESTDDDDDYTSGGESTGTGHISAATSEFGDETSGADFTIITTKSIGDEDDAPTGEVVTGGWTTFSEVKELPDGDEVTEGIEVTGVSWSDPTSCPSVVKQTEDVVTPTSPEPQSYSSSNSAHRFVPIPPEDCENAPTHPYRSQFQAANSRLPFMTPIVEKTESSLGAATALTAAAVDKDYFTSKTPCRQNSRTTPKIVEGDGLWSSPFEEEVKDKRNLIEMDVKVPQPPLPKPTKTAKLPFAESKPVNNQNLTGSRRPPAVKEALPKGPIVKDAQCNPVDEHVRQQILDNVLLSTYEGFHDHRSHAYGKTAEIRKYVKAVAKAGKSANDKTSTTNLALPPQLRFEGTDRVYAVRRELGKGAFAPVYLAESKSASEEDDENAAAQMGRRATGVARGEYEAIKMEDPPTAWEFYIMRTAKRRLGVNRATDSLVNVHEMHLFYDEGYLIEDYRDQGTLLNVVNIARADPSGGGVMDEMLAMFFSVELLRTVEELHKRGIIHGDLKADNVLLRLASSPSSFSSSTSDGSWSSQYRRDGTDGWSERGIALIDFGRGIDMRAFQTGVQFIADWKTSEADCAEMREMRPWTFQVDYHGLAAIIHTLLFGRYIETMAERGGSLGAGATKTYRVREGLKRYWQTDIWGECFDLLLNPLMKLEGEEGGKMPLLKGMRAVREKMESYLEGNCEKGSGLKGMLRRLEGSVRDRRR